MLLNKRTLPKSPFATGLKTACSVLALTAGLAAGGAWAADQGARHHAKGQYDTVTATYGVVEGDELIVIGERFQVPVERAEGAEQLASNEVKAGQKLVVAASASPAGAAEGKKPNILFIMGDDIGWMQPSIYHRGLMVGETPNIDRIGQEGRSS